MIDRACADAEAVFWPAPDDADAPTADAPYADFTRPAARAFARHGVRRVVAVTALGRGTPLAEHAGAATSSRAMGDLIAASGVNFRAVACPSFMHNLLDQVGAIREQGLFFMMADPDLKDPAVAARTSPRPPYGCCSTPPGRGPARSPASVPRTCRRTTWPGPSPRCPAPRSATGRSPARRSGSA
ncbi:hypothetical protein AB0D38_34785 [Streptomyces sp. NPDC048279]|uniref:hypothetical protein n=1 Tax=Streptomyces sp. NPDC048279 TaxID=3154714 RepID=UPI003419F427